MEHYLQQYCTIPTYFMIQADFDLAKQNKILENLSSMIDVVAVPLVPQAEIDKLVNQGLTTEQANSFLSYYMGFKNALENQLIRDKDFILFLAPVVDLPFEFFKYLESIYFAFVDEPQIDLIDLFAVDLYKDDNKKFIINREDCILDCVSEAYSNELPYAFLLRKSAINKLLSNCMMQNFNLQHGFAATLGLDRILSSRLFAKYYQSTPPPTKSEVLPSAGQTIFPFTKIPRIKLFDQLSNNYYQRINTKNTPHKATINNLSILSYVITLENTPERLLNFSTNVDSQQITPFYGVYGKNLSVEEKEQLFDHKRFYEFAHRRAVDGEIGCMLSHFNLYKQIVEDSSIGEQDFVLIFEDDAVLSEDWVTKVNTLNQYLHDLEQFELIIVNSSIMRYHLPLPIGKVTRSTHNILTTSRGVYIDNHISVANISKYDPRGSTGYMIRKSAMRKAIQSKPWWYADNFTAFIELEKMLVANPVISYPAVNLQSLIVNEWYEEFKQRSSDPEITSYPPEEAASKIAALDQLIIDHLRKLNPQYTNFLLRKDY